MGITALHAVVFMAASQSTHLGETFQEGLGERRQESQVLVDNFASLTDVALESRGSSSFEWPRWCAGWTEVEELQDMITRHNMFSTYPCECAFGLNIQKVCRHPKVFSLVC